MPPTVKEAAPLTVLVTGANRGLGKALVEEFKRLGDDAYGAHRPECPQNQATVAGRSDMSKDKKAPKVKKAEYLEVSKGQHNLNFCRIIVDESQNIRNPSSTNHRVIRQLLKIFRSFGGCTATPTINRVTDIVGTSALVWQVSRLSEYLTPPDTLSFVQMAKRTWLHPEDGAKSWFGQKTPQEIKASLRIWQQRGFRWWLLHPKAQRQIVDADQPTKISLKIFEATNMYTCRRGMDTALHLPNGTVTYPREKIPAHTIVSEDLAYRFCFQEVSEATEAILKNVSFPSKHDGDTNQTADAVSGGDNSGGNPAASDSKKANEGLSLSLVRALCFLAMDYNSYRMLTSDDAITSMASEDLKAALANSGAHPGN
ncbi:hypothetical protein GGTG_08666 [Gaeumannomyces tritici R3-111a-1]|uniref:SNF2 N-terminal domain-containing protein n=1 Tax=Gaeumannomyces tritici (strain R3-111a-1) TaxID=644352 RepID=J3P577_GAET3|nr:hypothetical protein GGTG_08666 [Gaeumannomyces tritici R3-111a-1]EJT74828.1 hypothetical protein GGTG_08666 [Gaeumannomyces tritici R3-111a-1]